MTPCEQLKKHLLEHDEFNPKAHPGLQQHIDQCDQCRALFNAYQQIDDMLAEQPPVTAPEKLIKQTQSLIVEQQKPSRPTGHKKIAATLASAAVLLAAVGLTTQLFKAYRPNLATEMQNSKPEPARLPSSVAPKGLESEAEYDAISAEYRTLPELEEAIPAEAPAFSDDAIDEEVADITGSRLRRAEVESVAKEKQDLRLTQEEAVLGALEQNAPSHPNRSNAAADQGAGGLLDNERQRELSQLQKLERKKKQSTKRRGGVNLIPDGLGQVLISPDDFERVRSDHEETAQTETSGAFLRANPGAARAATDFDFNWYYEQTEHLSFVDARGYWANTYIPGDPQIRLLASRLDQADRSSLGDDWYPERQVSPYLQPFDIPTNNALGLQLSADTTAIDGPVRARLQVGIQAIEQRKGQRPALNLAVVMDLPDTSDTQALISARALLDALLTSRQAGDQFTLVSSHNGGKVMLASEDFKYGPLQLAKTELFESKVEQLRPVDLLKALEVAGQSLSQNTDPSQPDGSQSILLITADALQNAAALNDFIYQQAKSGVSLSIFPLGSKADSRTLEQLVLSGFGHLRVLDKPSEAQQLIETELYASSQAVARSARLSIRLANHVKLIEVVGSHKLEEPAAQRVRDIEQGMDQRLSANLGIQQDRGQDEDGIQIVIPSIQSGDSVVVLLDVLLEKPGDIAEVSLRYKDMVFLKNGSLAAQLNLPAGQPERKAQQLLVLKNLMAHHFKEAAGDAADALGRQQPDQALLILATFSGTLKKAIAGTTGWDKDPEIQADLKALNQYIKALQRPTSSQQQQILMESLRYAAWRKTHRSEQESD